MALQSKQSSELITVVSGLPRSGTSMMMSMLKAGGMSLLADKSRAPDASNPRGYFEFARVKKLKDGDIGWLAEAEGKAVKVISYLLRFLPDTYRYRLIFMQRDLSEVYDSQRQMLLEQGKDPDKVSRDQLVTILENHLGEVKMWIQHQPNMECIEVRYDEAVASPEDAAKRIERFLGRGLDTARMVDVVDPELYRQRS